jgi:Limiting CO2-inducible proteins B/C beta carbonyic anhydrases
VYGPHVGVDLFGNVGTVDRRGKAAGGACCGSAIAALNYVSKVQANKAAQDSPVFDPYDLEQSFVRSRLLLHADVLARAENVMVQLPFSLYMEQDRFMNKIVSATLGPARKRPLALLGGIQINTPAGLDDCFIPLRFEILDDHRVSASSLLSALRRLA